MWGQGFTLESQSEWQELGAVLEGWEELEMLTWALLSATWNPRRPVTGAHELQGMHSRYMLSHAVMCP